MVNRRAAAGERIATARLELVPLSPADAAEMAEMLSEPALYEFTGGAPPGPAELRERYTRLAAGSPDPGERWLNWIVRLRGPGAQGPGRAAVGTVQATIGEGGRQAEIAWVVGLAWQGRGYATEAARALVEWLTARGVVSVIAHIHPRHGASAAVAERAGLLPADEFTAGERLWRREVPPPG